MQMPDTFTPVSLGHYFKGWDSYKGDSWCRWFNASNVSSIFLHDNTVYAEIGFDDERQYAVGRFNDETEAKNALVRFVARVGGLVNLPNNVVADLVALEM